MRICALLLAVALFGPVAYASDSKTVGEVVHLLPEWLVDFWQSLTEERETIPAVEVDSDSPVFLREAIGPYIDPTGSPVSEEGPEEVLLTEPLAGSEP